MLACANRYLNKEINEKYFDSLLFINIILLKVLRLWDLMLICVTVIIMYPINYGVLNVDSWVG